MTFEQAIKYGANWQGEVQLSPKPRDAEVLIVVIGGFSANPLLTFTSKHSTRVRQLD